MCGFKSNTLYSAKLIQRWKKKKGSYIFVLIVKVFIIHDVVRVADSFPNGSGLKKRKDILVIVFSKGIDYNTVQHTRQFHIACIPFPQQLFWSVHPSRSGPGGYL